MRENRTYGSERGGWAAMLGKQLVRHTRGNPETEYAEAPERVCAFSYSIRMEHMGRGGPLTSDPV